MIRSAAGPATRSHSLRPVFAAAVLIVGCTISWSAIAEPPITSARDAACRDVARSQVFSAPDPYNLGLRELGRRIYQACMGKSGKSAKRKRHHRRRR